MERLKHNPGKLSRERADAMATRHGLVLLILLATGAVFHTQNAEQMMTELTSCHSPLEQLVEKDVRKFDSLKILVAQDARNLNVGWIILCSTLIFFMQGGFAILETGILHPKNVTDILFKNMIDVSLAAFVFWSVGYGVGWGNTFGGFIGTSNWYASSCVLVHCASLKLGRRGK